MEEQTQNHSEESNSKEADFNELDVHEMKEKLQAEEQETKEQDNENSLKESEENSKDEQTEETQDSDEEQTQKGSEDGSESDESDRQNSLKSKLEDMQAKLESKDKDYKELQSWATKTNQKLKEIEKSKQETERGKFEEILESFKDDAPQIVEALKYLDKTREQKEADEENFPKQKLEETVQQLAEQNQEAFKNNLKSFLEEHDYLADETADVLDELYPTDEELSTAAKSNPKLFNTIKEKVLSTNIDKVIEAQTSKKLAEEKSLSNQVDQEIAKSKGVGKPRTSKKVSNKEFKDLSPDEMKKHLVEQEKKLKK